MKPEKAELVGWVERSDTHQSHRMGIALLNPSYKTAPE
jgi:hypothetical protein